MKAEDVKRIIQAGKAAPEGKYQEYGVLVPLIETTEGCCVVLETRASTLKRQPGEISLP
ncbi:MAG: CoA pyrophosphatase, partial [Clostridiales bacterium]|nr:CoA pyrophosphatase [Clostridiales bacterium]